MPFWQPGGCGGHGGGVQCAVGVGVSVYQMGYRLFAIDATDTASIMCFAGVRFMLSALLVYAGGAALRRGPLPMPRAKICFPAAGWACGRLLHSIPFIIPPLPC